MHESEGRLKSLMLRGLDGDGGAHRELLTECGRLLTAYFSRRLGAGASEKEDLVQDVLMAIHARRATFDRSQLFTAWAFAIARYKYIDFVRRDRSRSHQPLDGLKDLFGHDPRESTGAAADVERLIVDLPERQRNAIRHVKLEELSVAETARRMGVSESVVKVSVHRGLKKLSERFGRTKS